MSEKRSRSELETEIVVQEGIAAAFKHHLPEKSAEFWKAIEKLNAARNELKRLDRKTKQ